MTQLMPLRRAVIEITHEARADDPIENNKAIRAWHNRLQNGSIPRSLVKKLGRELFLDLEAWDKWLVSRDNPPALRKCGRPRSI